MQTSQFLLENVHLDIMTNPRKIKYLLHSIDLESSSILWISLNLYFVTSPSQVGAGSIPASEFPSLAHS